MRVYGMRCSMMCCMGMMFRNSKNFGPFRINTSSGGVGGSTRVGPMRITQRADGRQSVTIRTPIRGLNFTKTFGSKRR